MLYKVITNSKKSYNADSKFAITYSDQEFVKPVLEGSKIFAFDNLRCAKDFLRWSGTNINELWSAATTGTIDPVIFRARAFDECIMKFWRGEWLDKEYVPDGTVLVDDLKLIDKIYDFHDA